MAVVNVNPPRLTAQDVARFWQRVNQNANEGPDGNCWPWTMAVTGNGYGTFDVGGRQYSTHRLAYFLYTGDWPLRSVCHTCDWRPCCNPAHLFEGSAADNAADARSKDRYKCGEKVFGAKLTAALVREIRSTYKGTRGDAKAFAERYGVSRQTIWKITRGVVWRHVD